MAVRRIHGVDVKIELPRLKTVTAVWSSSAFPDRLYGVLRISAGGDKAERELRDALVALADQVARSITELDAMLDEGGAEG